VGIAKDVAERIKKHNWGVGVAFTATRRPVPLVWKKEYSSAKQARLREKELKGWRRKKKLELIEREGTRGDGLKNPSPAWRRVQGKGE